MKKMIKKLLRSYCPNIPVLRNKLSKIKLKEINRYTINTEDVLSGENEKEKQEKIVSKYREMWPDYFEELEGKLDEYISRCESVRRRKDLAELRIKVLFACIAYGFMPDEFFAFQLENKSAEERKSYISNRERYNYVYQLNDIIDMDIFLDKYKTYQKFKKYYRRDAICVEKPSDYKVFCNFVEKHPVFVAKNVGLSKGDSVELIDCTTCSKTPRQLFDEMRQGGKYIVEECVQQSHYMSQVSLRSVNTIRCITFMIDDRVKIGPCFFKAGQGSTFVDNAGAGGIVVGIDRKTGKLVTDGFDEFCNRYLEHPDTGIHFKGFKMPEWEQMIELVKEMAALTPNVKYIGWDLAHTDNGWVVIEGNGGGQFIIPQIVWQRGFKEDIKKLVG